VSPPSNYSPLFLGHIVSKYYLSHLTARAFTEMLGPDTNEAEALRLLASCEEYVSPFPLCIFVTLWQVQRASRAPQRGHSERGNV
jgi:hypothetical protein